MHLTKHHVFGNDFLVALDAGDGDSLAGFESGGDPCPPGWVRAVCNRTSGVGADGIMWARGLPDPPPGDADPVARHSGEGRNPLSSGPAGASGERRPVPPGPLRAAMRLYNADGGEAEVSGNGLACLAQALTLRAGRDEAGVVVTTVTGERRVVIERSRFADADDTGAGFGRIRSRAGVDLGEPATDVEQTRRAGAVLADLAPAVVRAGWVSVGNPHVVALLADGAALEALALEPIGAAVQQRFGPVNFEAVAVADRSRVRMRVWERGVGVTSACGSGAAAVAWQLHRWGLVEQSVEIEMPGGLAEVTAGGTVELRVPVIYVADVEAPEPVIGGDS